MRAPEISIVIPVYNERESLPALAAELRAAIDSDGRAYEILFVDDGSSDGSADVLRSLVADDPRFRLLRLVVRRGQSTALVAGFRAARGALVVTLDADLQNDPADIPRLVAQLGDDDLVSGYRVNRRDTWLRRASSRIANAVRSRITGDAVSDVGCSLKVYRKALLDRVPPFNGMHRFLPALLRMEGARIKEVPVNHRPRRYGESKYSIRNRLWRSLVDLAGVRWMQKRWIDRRSTEEAELWTSQDCGSRSDSPDRLSSSPAFSSSGSHRRSGNGA